MSTGVATALDSDVPPLLGAILRLLALTLVLNAVVYGAELLFGWSNDIRSIGGAVLIILGALFSMGSSGGRHLAEKAQATPVTAHDFEQYGKDMRASLSAGVTFSVIGMITLALAILFP